MPPAIELSALAVGVHVALESVQHVVDVLEACLLERLAGLEAELAEAEKAAKEQEKKQRAAKDKELEVNWGIGPNDLQTKIGTLARLMEGPVKVTVKFGRKKGSKTKLEYADMEELVRKVREQISEMGAREHKPAEGFIGKTMMLHFASKHA